MDRGWLDTWLISDETTFGDVNTFSLQTPQLGHEMPNQLPTWISLRKYGQIDDRLPQRDKPFRFARSG